MIYRPRYNHIVYHKQHLKGTGMGSVILDGGIGGQSAYSSLEDYKHTVNGKGLANKLEKLVMKEPTIKRPKNIRLNF
jgi:hypothetical protein